MKKKYFFGWTNLKWFVKELIAMGSDKPSYFSQKKVQMWIAFFLVQYGILHWFILHINSMGSDDLAAWAYIEMPFIGMSMVAIHQANKLKLDNNTVQPNT